MSRTTLRRLPWVAAISLILLSGCYTVIMHPAVENERQSADQLRANCIDCHADYHVYPYDPYDHFFGADYYWQNPRYGYYYGYPWWWDDYYWYYYFDPEDPGGYPANPRQESRPVYRGGAPARSTGAGTPTVGTTPLRTGGGVTGPPGRGNVTPGTGETGVSDSSTTDEGLRQFEGEKQPLTGDHPSVGQAPWSRPTGGAGPKPPELRQGLDEGEIPAGKSSKTGAKSTTDTPTKSAPQKTTTPAEKQSEPAKQDQKQEEQPPQPRGRPARNPG